MLLWERLKYQDRFKDYRDKVVHIVLDDTAPLDIPQIPGTHFDPSVDGRWKIEHRDTIAGFRAFLAWNQTTKFLTEGDVFISVCPKYTYHIVHTLTFHINVTSSSFVFFVGFTGRNSFERCLPKAQILQFEA